MRIGELKLQNKKGFYDEGRESLLSLLKYFLAIFLAIYYTIKNKGDKWEI